MEVAVNFSLSVLFAFISLFVNIVSTETCDKQTSCSCKTSSDFVMDLSSLPLMTTTGFKDNIKYTYTYKPCGKMNCGDQKNDVAVCQSDGTASYCAGLDSTATFSGDLSSLNLQYTCNSGGTLRTTNINVVCGDGNSLSFVSDESKEGTGKYNLKLSTEHACKKSGLSPGSTLLLIFFILVIVYLIGGILFMKFVKGGSGVELVPNLEFWKGLPGLIKDGILFTVRGCKTDTTYSQI